MSLNNAINTQPGNYINGTVTATVKFAKERQGKFGPYQTAVLSDGTNEVSAVSDGLIFVSNNNKTVTFSGKGMKRKDDYNGKPQVAFGKQVQVSAAGEPTPAEAHSAATQAFPTDKAPAPSNALKGEDLAKAWASLALATRNAFNEAGMHEIADNAALRAPEWGALWWFGQRTVETTVQTEDNPY